MLNVANFIPESLQIPKKNCLKSNRIKVREVIITVQQTQTLINCVAGAFYTFFGNFFFFTHIDYDDVKKMKRFNIRERSFNLNVLSLPRKDKFSKSAIWNYQKTDKPLLNIIISQKQHSYWENSVLPCNSFSKNSLPKNRIPPLNVQTKCPTLSQIKITFILSIWKLFWFKFFML